MQTVMGAGRLAAESDTPPGTLREQVTSPGGTTAAGLAVLMPELQSLMIRTVTAARATGGSNSARVELHCSDFTDWS